MTDKTILLRRRRLLLGVAACALMMISDYLWKAKGYSPVSTTLGSFADTAWLDIPMWRLVVSNLLAAAAVPLYYIGFMEMVRMIREHAHSKSEERLARLFRFGVIAGTISFVFIHTLCVSMPMMMQLIEPYTGTVKAAELVNRYMKLNIAPMIVYFLAADGVISVVTVILVWRRTLPVNRLALVCNPLCAAAIGSILTQLPWPLSLIDTIAEPCGHLLVMIVALIVFRKDIIQNPHGGEEDDLPPIINLDDEPDSDVTVI